MKWTQAIVRIGTLLSCSCGSAGSTEPLTQPSTTGAVPLAGTGALGAAVSGTSAAPRTAGAPATTTLPQTGAGTQQPTVTPTQNAGVAGAALPTAAAGAGGAATTLPDSCPTCAIPVQCRGFPFDGIKYSPGGSVLPNTCMPYHATLNNPYAVRCIDALPNFKTKFAGDQYCILPPPPDKGFQVGLHPQGKTADYWKAIWAGDLSGYDTTDKDWVLQPGDERTQNYRTRDAPGLPPTNYYRTYFRMRTGSHHMIVTMHDGMEEDGWIPGAGEALPGLFDTSSGAVQGILGGEQRPDDSTPVTIDKPKEDEGLYLVFPADPSIIFNMHHFNTTDGLLTREGWINIWKEEDARTKMSWYMGMEAGQVISLSVAPNTTADLHYSWTVNSDMRLIRVFGHRHFWTTNFSAWIQRKDGKIDLAYQSYDWFDMPTYRYDSVVQNPAVNPSAAQDGAISGIVSLKAGDKLHFNCHIEFTDERQATDKNAPTPQQIGRLRFANEAYNGEMCIQFGNVTGGALGLPGVDSSPVPDFAKITRPIGQK